MTGEFDTAYKGESALIAAALRNLAAEFYSYTEQQVIGVFRDIAKFLDNIDIPILRQQAIDLNFPISDMASTKHQHLAPRVIQCEGCCGQPTLTTTSILAGSKLSVALTGQLTLTGVTNIT